MKYTIEDKKYKFKSFFDTESGFYMCTGVLDENGKDTGLEPFMASYPHLIDAVMSYGTETAFTGVETPPPVFTAKPGFAQKLALVAIKVACVLKSRI